MQTASLSFPQAAPGKHAPPFAPDDPSPFDPSSRDLARIETCTLLSHFGRFTALNHPHCTSNGASGFEMMMSPSTAPSGAGLQDQGSARQLRKELAAGDVGREG